MKITGEGERKHRREETLINMSGQSSLHNSNQALRHIPSGPRSDFKCVFNTLMPQRTNQKNMSLIHVRACVEGKTSTYITTQAHATYSISLGFWFFSPSQAGNEKKDFAQLRCRVGRLKCFKSANVCSSSALERFINPESSTYSDNGLASHFASIFRT